MTPSGMEPAVMLPRAPSNLPHETDLFLGSLTSDKLNDKFRVYGRNDRGLHEDGLPAYPFQGLTVK
jgi:hypothetical protein